MSKLVDANFWGNPGDCRGTGQWAALRENNSRVPSDDRGHSVLVSLGSAPGHLCDGTGGGTFGGTAGALNGFTYEVI